MGKVSAIQRTIRKFIFYRFQVMIKARLALEKMNQEKTNKKKKKKRNSSHKRKRDSKKVSVTSKIVSEGKLVSEDLNHSYDSSAVDFDKENAIHLKVPGQVPKLD